MSTKITVIYTDDTKPRRYIMAISRRDEVTDNNLLAELTDDPEEAKDFGSKEKAMQVIPNLHNPFERVYQSITLKVDFHMGYSAKSDMY